MSISLIFVISLMLLFLFGVISFYSYKRYCSKQENNNLTYENDRGETLI